MPAEPPGAAPSRWAFNGRAFASFAEYQKQLLDHRWAAPKEPAAPTAIAHAEEAHAHAAEHHPHAEPLQQLRAADHREGRGDFAMMSRFGYLFESVHRESLLKRIAHRLTAPGAFRPDAFDHAYYDSLTEPQKRVRVLLALEKLSFLNHHCFSPAERRLLTPSNQGWGSKAYNLSAHAGLVWYLYFALVRRRGAPLHLLALGALGTLNYAWLQGLPLRVKEHFRVRRALSLAEGYYRKYNGSMEVFALILHPHTSHRVLEHLSL